MTRNKTPEKLTRSEQARINGAKSKGPSTPEGKAISSRNSLKHGFAAAATTVLTIEDEDDWQIHLDNFRQSFNPQTYVEHAFVEQLASINWRQCRLARIETSLIELQLSIQNTAIEDTHPSLDHMAPFHLVLAWQGLARQPQKPPVDAGPLPHPEGHDITSIELCRRYIMTLDRQYRNVLLNLRQYRKDFAPALAPEPAPLPAPEPKPAVQQQQHMKQPVRRPDEPNALPVRKPAATEIRPAGTRNSSIEPVNPRAAQRK